MVKRRALKLVPKQGVSLTYWPEKKGIIVAVGDEVTEVKFPSGSEFVINRFLMLEEE